MHREKQMKNYLIQDNYDTEEEYEDAESASWDMVDRKYDEWKNEQLMGDDCDENKGYKVNNKIKY